jgi:hypothetical protein
VSTEEIVIGHLMWQAVECRTGTLVSEGDRLIWRSDVTVQRGEDDGKAVIPKTVSLSPPFTLTMGEFPVPTLHDLVGFGLGAENLDLRTFSWEWFTVDGARAFTEEGFRLEIETEETPLGWQVSRTQFMSDVSLKIFDFDSEEEEPEPEWCVTIRKDSYIEWPLE